VTRYQKACALWERVTTPEDVAPFRVGQVCAVPRDSRGKHSSDKFEAWGPGDLGLRHAHRVLVVYADKVRDRNTGDVWLEVWTTPDLEADPALVHDPDFGSHLSIYRIESARESLVPVDDTVTARGALAEALFGLLR
jgi:hypothetical protein